MPFFHVAGVKEQHEIKIELCGGKSNREGQGGYENGNPKATVL
ncbi:hypothetical protein [Aeribacillus pallidus]|nr:hypothetical protein [Aeribacillus pallidus]